MKITNEVLKKPTEVVRRSQSQRGEETNEAFDEVNLSEVKKQVTPFDGCVNCTK